MTAKNLKTNPNRKTLKEFEENALSSKERADFSNEYGAYRTALMRARNSISEILSAAMREKGIRYEDLTRELGLSRTTISRLLNGTGNPTLDTLFYVTSYLDVRLDFAFTTKKNEFEPTPKPRAGKRKTAA